MYNIQNEKTIAVLIDADNTDYKKIGFVLEKISTYGRVIIKRAYGNWNKGNLKPWFEISQKYAINQIQQTDYVSGKNASDIALVIDAMDFVTRAECDMFVIVSSDSDFTPLAMKLKELNKTILGIGKKKTTIDAFINACDEFIFIDDIDDITFEEPKDKKCTLTQEELKLIRLLKTATDINSDEEFTNICSAGNYIKRAWPEYTNKMCGVKSLTEFIEKEKNRFDVRRREGKGGVTIVEYKIK